MRNYLIRVQLPDRPGALGAVASRIGSVGGDVIAIDILERDGGRVVDELGVGLAGDHLVRLVRDEILEVDGVVIESVRTLEGALPDRDAELLALATGLFAHEAAAGLLADLADRARRGLEADVALVVHRASSTVVASAGAVPAGSGVEELLAAADGTTGTSGPTGLAVELGDAGLTLVLGRAEPGFRSGERQWVSVLAGLADQGVRALAVTAVPAPRSA